MPEENDATPIATALESSASSPQARGATPPSGWLKVGVVAAASALAGGLAAAWYYRKTLAQLRQSDGHGQNSEFRIPGSDAGEDD
ncbi:MAG: hypothetical protein WCA11_14590 [Terracidiphilus sp.]